jgi:hypothetical protein
VYMQGTHPSLVHPPPGTDRPPPPLPGTTRTEHAPPCPRAPTTPTWARTNHHQQHCQQHHHHCCEQLLAGWIRGAGAQGRLGGGGRAREMGDDTSHPCHEVRETAGTGNDTGGPRERERRQQLHLPHAFKHLLIGWFTPASRPRRQGTGQGRRTRGQEPSTRHPPLRAFACRVDWVLMAMSPPVDSHPLPTPAVLLFSKVVVFRYLAPAASPGAALLILYD